MSVSAHRSSRRRQLELLVGADVERMVLTSDRRFRSFAARRMVSAHALRALIIVVTGAMSGERVTAGDLCRGLKMSQAATSGLITQLTVTGHLRREVDPSDRRKVILRHTDAGITLARAFSVELTEHVHHALRELPDSDLEAAHRAFTALIGAESPRGRQPAILEAVNSDR